MQGLPRHRPVSRSKHPSGICYTHADLHLLLAAAAAAAASYKDAVTIDHACACVMRARVNAVSAAAQSLYVDAYGHLTLLRTSTVELASTCA